MRADIETRKKIEKITWIGLLANVALSMIKLVIGWTGGSQAVVADALHSFSDTASDVVILFGVRYWTAPPDDCHPFGHQKIESFVTIVISLILLGVAAGIGTNAIVCLMPAIPPPAAACCSGRAPAVPVGQGNSVPHHICRRRGKPVLGFKSQCLAPPHRCPVLHPGAGGGDRRAHLPETGVSGSGGRHPGIGLHYQGGDRYLRRQPGRADRQGNVPERAGQYSDPDPRDFPCPGHAPDTVPEIGGFFTWTFTWRWMDR